MNFPWTKRREAAQASRDAVLVSRARNEALSEFAGILRSQFSTDPILGKTLPQGNPRFPLYHWDTPYRYALNYSPKKRPDALVTNDTLRALADTYDIARSCINEIKRQVYATPVTVVAVEDDDKSAATAATIADARRWLATSGGIGGEGVPRREFEMSMIEDLMVIGATSIYFPQTFGGKAYEAITIDAGTIKPKVDAYGWTDDALVYEQWVHGVYQRGFTRAEMLYSGLWPVSYTPYYKSNTEYLLYTINAALKSDEWNLTWLTDGTTPSDIIAAPESWTPEDILTFADWIRTTQAGNTRERQQLKIMPGGSSRLTGNSRKDQDFQEFQLWLLRRTCSIYGVQPASIGFAGEQYKVSQEGSMSKTSEFGVGMVLEFRDEMYTNILERAGFEGVRVSSSRKGEEGRKDKTGRLVTAAGGPFMTVNEARAEDGLDPIDDDGADEIRNMPTGETPAEPGRQPLPAKEDDKEERRADLLKWQKKAIQRLRNGKQAYCDFRSDVISVPDAASIENSLERADSERAVRQIFDRYLGNTER